LITDENKELFSEDICSICISEFSSGETVRKLACKHYFHHDCIKAWISKSQLCPNCKSDAFFGALTQINSAENEIAERNRRSREVTRRAFNQLGIHGEI